MNLKEKKNEVFLLNYPCGSSQRHALWACVSSRQAQRHQWTTPVGHCVQHRCRRQWSMSPAASGLCSSSNYVQAHMADISRKFLLPKTTRKTWIDKGWAAGELCMKQHIYTNGFSTKFSVHCTDSYQVRFSVSKDESAWFLSSRIWARSNMA